jgi:YtcA family
MLRFRMSRAIRITGVSVGVATPTAGCTHAPSANVLGAYFPDWLFCIVAGVAFAVAAYLILERKRYGDRLGPSALLYPALVAFFSLVAWLIFFQN